MAELDDVLAENARLRAEADQRAAELAVVNRVQHALAAQTDMEGRGKSESVRVYAVER